MIGLACFTCVHMLFIFYYYAMEHVMWCCISFVVWLGSWCRWDMVARLDARWRHIWPGKIVWLSYWTTLSQEGMTLAPYEGSYGRYKCWRSSTETTYCVGMFWEGGECSMHKKVERPCWRRCRSYATQGSSQVTNPNDLFYEHTVCSFLDESLLRLVMINASIRT